MTSTIIYHIVYETTNLVNGKIYRGVHSTKNINDGYLGSGIKFGHALKKYGKSNFQREILFCAFTREYADEIEALFVSKQWLEDNSRNIYNIAIGGSRQYNYLHLSDGSVKHRTEGKVSCVDITTGDTYQIDKSTFDSSTNLAGVTVGMSPYLNLDTMKTECLRINDPKLSTGKYKHHNKGKVNVIRNGVQMKIEKTEMLPTDMYATNNLPHPGEVACHDIRTGKRFHVSKETFKADNNLVGITVGKSVYKDKSGARVHTFVDDDRVKSGELIQIMTGLGQFKDDAGTVYNLPKGDPLIKELNLKGMTSGHMTVYDLSGNTVYISNEEFRLNQNMYKRINSGRKRVYSETGIEMLLQQTDDRIISGEYKTRTEWRQLGNKNIPERKPRQY